MNTLEHPGSSSVSRMTERRQGPDTSIRHWQEIEPDVKVRTISQLLRKTDAINAINIVHRSLEGPLVFISKECKEKIYAHVLSTRKEMGGLLIGNTYSLPYHTRSGYDFVTFISHAIPSTRPQNSRVSVRMDVEIWNGAKNHINHGKLVVGWYHSHPEIGAFFSGIDKATQKGFFKNPYSLGIVIDPYRNEMRCYFGADSIEMDCRLETVVDQTALMCLATSQ